MLPTVLIGVSVFALVDVGFMHRDILAQGRAALAKQEMVEKLRSLCCNTG